MNILENFDFKKKNTWLVTGAAGFIGSNVLEYLLKKKQKVIGIDSLINSKIETINIIKKKNKFKKNFIFFKKDIFDINFDQKVFYNVNFVIHLASLGSVPRSYDNPQLSIKNNINITIHLISSFKKKKKLKRIIFTSSSSIYGDQLTSKKDESMKPNPKSPYAISKLSVEMYSELFSKKYNLPITILRLFNVFGPFQRTDSIYSAVIPKWIKNLNSNNSINIYGSKKISRDFTHVNNVIYSICLIYKKNKSIKKFDVFNLACGKSIKLKEVITSIQEALSIPRKKINNMIKMKKNREGDIFQSKACISKSKKILGYRPLMPFKEGIKETINWYLKNNNYLK
jgi:nucleoside-diphosphate-sugar epimerase